MNEEQQKALINFSLKMINLMEALFPLIITGEPEDEDSDKELKAFQEEVAETKELLITTQSSLGTKPDEL